MEIAAFLILLAAMIGWGPVLLTFGIPVAIVVLIVLGDAGHGGRGRRR